MRVLETRPYLGGRHLYRLVLAMADGSSHGQPLVWMVVSIKPETGTVWSDTDRTE